VEMNEEPTSTQLYLSTFFFFKQKTAYEIKHGEKINVYSAYSDDYGNPELPEKFKKIYTRQ
jgi:hypothetical protein